MTRKQPKDYKRKREPFDFAIDGVAYRFRAPIFDEMKQAKDAGDDIESMLSVFTACSDEATVAAIGQLELPDVNELFKDWISSYAPDDEAGKSGGSST